MEPKSNACPSRTQRPSTDPSDSLRGSISLLQRSECDPRPLARQTQSHQPSTAHQLIRITNENIDRTPFKQSTMSTTTTTTSLWTGSEQPIFNAWECATPVDEFFEREPCYEQWYRDLHAQDEAHRHFMMVLAALNRHQHDPSPPRCFTKGAGIAYSPSPPSDTGALHEFSEMRAAVKEVRTRRRANTI